jgi:probable phosphoglycerate mutase
LTALGRRQARRTAARFRECTVAKIYSSDLQRAKETAAIIAERLGSPLSTMPMLREIIPTHVPGHQVPLHKRRTDKQSLERAIARFLTRSPRSGDTLVVCHGNFIRALTCRILETSVTKWQLLGTFHCAITTFRFKDDGQLQLQCFNDTGHLPMELRTMM